MLGIVIGFVWCISGTLPAMIVWPKLYGESAPRIILIVSAIGGPFGGIANCFCFWQIRRKRKRGVH